MAKEKENDKLVITKEICEKVLLLDCRTEDGVRRLKKSLMKLPMISGTDDLETDMLEAKIKKVERKFAVHLSYLMRSVVDCEDHYSGMVKHNTGTWLKTVYGITTWEVYAKTLFYLYFYISDERRKAKNRIVKDR